MRGAILLELMLFDKNSLNNLKIIDSGLHDTNKASEVIL